MANPCQRFPGVRVGTPSAFNVLAMRSKAIPAARSSFMRWTTSISPGLSPYGFRPSHRPVFAFIRCRAPRSFGLFSLRNCALKLPEHDPERIVLQEAGLQNGDQFKVVLFEFGDDGLLYRKIPCQSVQLLDQYESHSVCMKGRKHLRECRALVDFLCASHAAVSEDLNDPDVVDFCVGLILSSWRVNPSPAICVTSENAGVMNWGQNQSAVHLRTAGSRTGRNWARLRFWSLWEGNHPPIHEAVGCNTLFSGVTR